MRFLPSPVHTLTSPFIIKLNCTVKLLAT